jgi:hypothetical protein
MSLTSGQSTSSSVGTQVSDSVRTRSESWAVLALTSLYFAVFGGHNYSIDGLLIYRQALSVVQNFSLRFAVPVHWGNYVAPTSISGIGLPLFYLPGVALFAKLGVHAPVPTSNPYDWDLLYRDPVYALGAAPVQILVTVATAYLLFRFVRELGFGTKVALLGFASYGIASPAVVYAKEDFPQPLLALLLIAGLLAAHRYRSSGGHAWLLAAGGTLVLAVLTRQVEGSFLLPALVLMIVKDVHPRRWDRGTVRDIAVIIGAYAIAVALTLLINWGRFGSPFQTGYSQISWETPIWIGLPGILFSPSRGILWQFPLLVLAPLGLRRLWLTPQRRVAAVMAVLIVVFYIHTSLWIPWWGGDDWGARLFVPVWPLVAILAAVGAVSLRPSLRLWLPAILFLGGVVWAIPGTLVDLLGGYASAYGGTPHSFLLTGYPPIGAWQFLHHLRAVDTSDPAALDIFWVRLARRTGNASLLVPSILMLATGAFAWKSIRVARAHATWDIASGASSGSTAPLAIERFG